ncbi:uncharacterized protein LOC141622406 [Silene latifolia]|uniref:uncharacterized protein LOC141622406 n=1 Tax=Silene latifolia TaxID=37657 RepID=UPI003D77A30F
MKSERWLSAATLDDKVVAGLLLQLKDSPSSSSPPSLSPPSSSMFSVSIPPSWGLRQPRSTSSSSLSEKKGHTATRRSPTTPLSFTNTSPSQESSELNLCHLPSDRLRSKISAASDTPTTSSKQARKKKSFAQLKVEESSLLNERTYLKKELTTLRATLNEQRSINENLKRIKLDLQVESSVKPESNHHVKERNMSLTGAACEATSSSVSRQVKTEDVSVQLRPAEKAAPSQEPIFVLPDLNMAPDQECDVLA